MNKSRLLFSDYNKCWFLLLYWLFLLEGCQNKEPEVSSTPSPVTPPAKVNTITNAVAQFGQLQVQGNRIVDKNNNPVQLRGMSLFWSQWIGKYYTPEAVKWLKDDWRCTVVRAAMAVDYEGYLKNSSLEKQKVITVVDAAIAQGLYVIIDWHDHEAEKHTEQAKAFFAEMARRYGDKPNVIYEIFNEPLDVSWSGVIKPYSEAVIGAIRQYDPDNLIICGTRNWSQQVEEAADDPIKQPNVAYTLHFYAATHKQWLRDEAAHALNKGIALMVTEFGTCEASGNGAINQAETKAWWKFLDDNKISWCNWSIADKEETSAALKSGAKTTGNWANSEISASGLLVREELQANNPK